MPMLQASPLAMHLYATGRTSITGLHCSGCVWGRLHGHRRSRQQPVQLLMGPGQSLSGFVACATVLTCSGSLQLCTRTPPAQSLAPASTAMHPWRDAATTGVHASRQGPCSCRRVHVDLAPCPHHYMRVHNQPPSTGTCS